MTTAHAPTALDSLPTRPRLYKAFARWWIRWPDWRQERVTSWEDGMDRIAEWLQGQRGDGTGVR